MKELLIIRSNVLVVKCVDPKISISNARFSNGVEQLVDFVEVFKFIVILSVDFVFFPYLWTKSAILITNREKKLRLINWLRASDQNRKT